MPSAILLITGSELTRGETTDLNGPFLATELTSAGIGVEEVILAPDDPRLLAQALRSALARAEVVVLSGGLGPTADDHTVKVVAEVFGRPVLRHPEALARMRSRALARGMAEADIPQNYYKQAEVVEGAEVLLNPVGLAPGMILSTARGCLAVLPGVPRELRALFRELVLVELSKRFRLEPPRILRAKIMGQGESWAEARIQKLGIDFGAIEYGISAKPGELLVKFIAHRPEHHSYLDQVRRLLEGEFGEDLLLLPEGLKDAAGAPLEVEHGLLVHRLLLERKATVATAESASGGLIAKRLTDHAGSSAYFLGSVVAYHDRVKEAVLGVPGELLRERGAVSEEVCRAMASGARRLFGADFAVADTGIAGPGGGSAEKPVGLAYLAVAGADPSTGREEVLCERRVFWGDRRNVRALIAVRALDLLRRAVKP
jgi:nicotinamide-nucleotide amidase